MPKTRNTLQREIVLDAVLSLHSHPTAEDIYTHVQTGYPNISRATVYRNLGVLADMGKIRRVSHLDAADRFDHTLAPHYHFRCAACGGVFDVDLPYDGGLLARVPNKAGFLLQGYDISFTGLCPACAAAAQAAPPETC